MVDDSPRVSVPRQPIGIDRFQCRGELALRDQILSRPNVAELREKLSLSADPSYSRRDLLRHAMKVTPVMSPAIHKMLSAVRRILDTGERDFELFVFPSADLNAYVTPAPGGRVHHVALSSAILEKFSPREILAILGHEIGHAIAGHTGIPISLLLAEGGDILSTLDAYRLMALSRYHEITADRASLLCAQDFVLAAGCLLKTASGVTTGALRFSLSDYLAQLEEIKTLEDVKRSNEDWFSTHPFSPLRVKAMEIFCHSQPFQSLTGRGQGGLSFEEMEAQLDEIMSLMNPSYLSAADDEIQCDLREWLAMAGVFVALASGGITPEEVRQLGETLGAETLQARLPELAALGPEALHEKLAGAAESLFVRTPPAVRLQVVRDLVLIAVADGSIEEAELGALAELSGRLGIAPFFVQQTIDEVSGSFQKPAAEEHPAPTVS